MALKVLLLRNKLDSRKKKLDELREKEQEFEKREAELEAAIEEMTEETPEEERDVVEQQAEQFQTEKDTYEKEKKDLETEIAGIEEEIRTEEEKQPKPEKKEKREKGEGKMETRRMEHGVFFGMNMQERDAMMAREDVKGFMEQVRECIKNKRALTNVGLTIPDIMLPMIRQVATESSKLMKYVTVRPVSGTSRQNIMGEIPEAIWDEMCASIKELNLAFYNMEMDGYKVSGYFAVCNSVLEDSDVSLAAELINALGKAIGKAIDKAILYGKNVKMPMGIVTSLLATQAPDGYPATGRKWEDLSTTHSLLCLNTCVSGTSSSLIGLVRYHKLSSFHVISSSFKPGSNSRVISPPKFLATLWHPVIQRIADISKIPMIFFIFLLSYISSSSFSFSSTYFFTVSNTLSFNSFGMTISSSFAHPNLTPSFKILEAEISFPIIPCSPHQNKKLLIGFNSSVFFLYS